MKKATALLALLLASVALVACGSSDDGSTTESNAATTGGGSAEGTALDVEADPGGQLAYTTDKLSTKAGTVTIDFKNPQALMHDVAIEDSSGKELGGTDLIAESSTSTVVENLKPGSYTFFCTVPGHREAGMEGILAVK